MKKRNPPISFRLNSATSEQLSELARRDGRHPNQVAKDLLEGTLDALNGSRDQWHEDLLIIRAGMERMFERSNRLDELDEAVERLRGQRSDPGHINGGGHDQ